MMTAHFVKMMSEMTIKVREIAPLLYLGIKLFDFTIFVDRLKSYFNLSLEGKVNE